jgi:hypothetical protein
MDNNYNSKAIQDDGGDTKSTLVNGKKPRQAKKGLRPNGSSVNPQLGNISTNSDDNRRGDGQHNQDNLDSALDTDTDPIPHKRQRLYETAIGPSKR